MKILKHIIFTLQKLSIQFDEKGRKYKKWVYLEEDREEEKIEESMITEEEIFNLF